MVYDEYYDSNVEYIGTIPKSWDLVHNKHLFNKTKVIVGPNWDKYPILSLTKQGVIIKDIENNQGKMPSDFSIYQIVNPGNLLMCLFDIDVTPRCVGYIENKGIVSAAYTELSATTEIDMKYYYWWYLMLDIDKQLLHLSKNLRNSLPTEDFMALAVVKPPLKEQQQIANYLDKKTAKIDETIAKNEKLIQLLEEKRVALINQVVTKGLNPDVPMKDSGIEWMGKIPEYWRVSFLKRFVYSISSGKTKNCDENGKYPLYGSTGIIGYTNDMDYNGTFVLIARVGANAGKTHIAEGKMGITDNTLIVKYTPEINYKFLFYILTIYDFKTLTIGSGQPLITGNNVKDIKICVPPLNEQEQFVEYLDNKMTGIKSIISKIKKNIVLLKEYKTSLIHHVVTGKVDVRGEEL